MHRFGKLNYLGESSVESLGGRRCVQCIVFDILITYSSILYAARLVFSLSTQLIILY